MRCRAKFGEVYKILLLLEAVQSIPSVRSNERIRTGIWNGTRHPKNQLSSKLSAVNMTSPMCHRQRLGACFVWCLFLQQILTVSGQEGFWEGPYELPVIPAAVANLPDGKLLMWSAYDLLDSNRRGNGQTWTAIWDPNQPDVKPEGVLVKTTGHDSTFRSFSDKQCAHENG